MQLEFKSFCGHQPWFFVPDTGMPGGDAVLTAPDGTESRVVNTQLDPKAWDWPAIGISAPRMGFEAPGVFIDPGVYTLTVTQDDADGNQVVDTYTITVELDLVVLVTQGTLGELGRLNQLRTLLGRKPFDVSEGATADGYDEVELAAINKFRQARGWATLKGA